MKKIILFFAVILCVACEKALVQSDDYLNTRIALQGDYVQLESSPLTKSASNVKYYAFEIDEVTIYDEYYKGFLVRSDTTITHYASGLFTDIKNLNIKLKKEQKYRIRCSVIEDGADKLFVEDNCLYDPFVDDEITKAKITNEFIYREEKMVCAYVRHNSIHVEGIGKTSHAKVNRYYAEAFVDIKDNTNISLNLTRYNYGLHFNLIPPTEGTLTVKSSNFDYILDSTYSFINECYVYALPIKAKQQVLDISVEWIKKDGEIVDLSIGKTTFYNKTMTTINVNVNDRVDGSDIDINYDSEMSQDEIMIK